VIKLTVVFEIEEEELKELFESNEIKYSKKKAKELKEELEYTVESVQEALEETFQEVVSDRIQELFE